MNELNNLIDKALEKAKQDLNNEKIEAHYTPEFLIGLLEEIKEVANAKLKGDVYEIRREWSIANKSDRYIIYKNNRYWDSCKSIEEAQEYVANREGVISE